MSVKVGKFGGIVLPKRFGKNAGMNEGMWLIISEYMGLILVLFQSKCTTPAAIVKLYIY